MIVDTYVCSLCNVNVATVLDKCLITNKYELDQYGTMVRRKVPICPTCLVKIDYRNIEDPFAK